MSQIEGMDSSIQSMMSGNLGTSFNLDIDNQNFELRPTVALNCKNLSRRATVGGTIFEDNRESLESINNRASELEGTINTPQA